MTQLKIFGKCMYYPTLGIPVIFTILVIFLEQSYDHCKILCTLATKPCLNMRELYIFRSLQ